MTGRRAARLALAVMAGAASAAAAQDGASTAEEDVLAMLDCRALAIAHLQLADPETASASLGLAEVLREQANFAMILGFWGGGLGSVDAATRDMVLGERLLIENARRVTAVAERWTGAADSARALEACAPVVWRATKAVIDGLLDERAARTR